MAAKAAAAAAAAGLATALPPRATRTAVTAVAPAGLAVVPIRAASSRLSAARAAPPSPTEPLFVDDQGPYHSQFADAVEMDRDWLKGRLGVLEANQNEMSCEITGLRSDIQTLLTNVKRMLPELAEVDGVMVVKEEKPRIKRLKTEVIAGPPPEFNATETAVRAYLLVRKLAM